MTSVLIGEISSYKAIVIARFIKRNYPSVRVVTFDNRAFTGLFHTRFTHKHYVLKAKSTKDLTEDLSYLIARENITWFFPVHSDSIGEFLQKRHLFSNTLSYVGSIDDYQQLHNKQLLPALAAKTGLRVPVAYENLQQAKLPVVVKPSASSSAKNVNYIRTELERENCLQKNLGNYVVQEYVQGFGCGYSAFVRNGEILVGYGHKREAEFPVSGGSSVYRTAYEHPDMRLHAERILKEIKWSGFIMFEFKVNLQNELILIEINPRIWGSIHQGLANHCNYFSPLLGALANENVTRQQQFTFLAPQVFYSMMRYLLKGNVKPLLNFMARALRNKSDIAPLSDPFAWMSAVLRFVLK